MPGSQIKGGGNSKHAQQYTCAAPSPTPNVGFEVYVPGARCLEAQLTPLRHLRELARGSSFPTVENCYYYCSTDLGMTAPYYFMLVEYPDGNDCSCCKVRKSKGGGCERRTSPSIDVP